MSDVNWLTELTETESRPAAGDIAAALNDLAPLRAAAVRARLAGFELVEIMDMYGWAEDKALHLLAHGMTDLRRLLVERGVLVT